MDVYFQLFKIEKKGVALKKNILKLISARNLYPYQNILRSKFDKKAF